jgi:5-methylcytosine-specific restriction enzyme subunit McrC
MSRQISVFENTSLHIGPDGLSERQFDRLAVYGEKTSMQFFSIGHRSIRFKSYAGVLQVGPLTIEVLPKCGSVGDEDIERWRSALVMMLRRSGYLRLYRMEEARQRLGRAPLIEVFLRAFVDEVEAIAREGLARQYRTTFGNMPALKGRIVFPRHLALNLTRADRFFTCHRKFDRENIHNQVLVEALDIIGNLPPGNPVRPEAKRLLSEFENIDALPLKESDFERIRYDRRTTRYRTAHQLARLIILGYMPDFVAGRDDILALMFDMNSLYEAFITSELRRASHRRSPAVRIRAQSHRGFWRSGDNLRHLRPDIILESKERRAIVDAKWKLPDPRGPSDTDLRQIFAYNIHFNSDTGFLVYPRVGAADDFRGEFLVSDSGISGGRCHCCCVELFDEAGRFRRDIGTDLLESLIPQRPIQSDSTSIPIATDKD